LGRQHVVGLIRKFIFIFTFAIQQIVHLLYAFAESQYFPATSDGQIPIIKYLDLVFIVCTSKATWQSDESTTKTEIKTDKMPENEKNTV